MEFIKGKNILSEETFPCTDYVGCLYHMDGICTFNISKIQQRTARACYHDLLQSEIKSQDDYDVGML